MFTIFGVIAIGAVIVVPVVLMFDRERAKGDAPGTEDPPATRPIVLTLSAWGLAIIFGFAGPAIVPGTKWGYFMGTLLGKATYVVVVSSVFILLVAILQSLGLVPPGGKASTYDPKARWRKRDS